MFVTLVMHDAIAHEGGLCPPDNLQLITGCAGGGRGEGPPSPR